MKNNKINLNELKFQPIRKKYDNGIEIYNLTEEMKTEILKIIDSNFGENKMYIKETDVLLKVLPLVTNIYLPEDESIIQEIIDNPSDILEDVISEVGEMIIFYFKIIQKTNIAISELNEEQIKLVSGMVDSHALSKG